MENINRYRCHILSALSSSMMVGFSKSHHSETPRVSSISVSHNSRHVCLTISLFHTSFQFLEVSKYVLRSTTALVASSMCLRPRCRVRASLTILVKIGMKYFLISAVLVSKDLCATAESRLPSNIPWVGFKKSKPQSGRIIRDCTFFSIWNLGT